MDGWDLGGWGGLEVVSVQGEHMRATWALWLAHGFDDILSKYGTKRCIPKVRFFRLFECAEEGEGWVKNIYIKKKSVKQSYIPLLKDFLRDWDLRAFERWLEAKKKFKNIPGPHAQALLHVCSTSSVNHTQVCIKPRYGTLLRPTTKIATQTVFIGNVPENTIFPICEFVSHFSIPPSMSTIRHVTM